ncbi:WSSV549 [White spot syndrome virus]|uniref:WSSV549 n=1 Tax=White spot syndrome virus TaxID=342409 RepID=A0A2I6SCJ4_9VIRU|nr:WSSV549 [White spot syndrome virus]
MEAEAAESEMRAANYQATSKSTNAINITNTIGMIRNTTHLCTTIAVSAAADVKARQQPFYECIKHCK